MARVNGQSLISIVTQLLAATTPSPVATSVPEIDPNRVTPGIWGFLSFVFLIIACVFLYYSMRKQLKRVKFDDNAGEAGARSVDVFPRRAPVARRSPTPADDDAGLKASARDQPS